MTKQEIFINEIELAIEKGLKLSEDAEAYFQTLKDSKAKPAVELTENGIRILAYMQEAAEDYDNSFSAKNIGEGIGISGRSVSGSMRKLISEGFTEKASTNPVTYSLTSKGKEKVIEN